MTHIHRDKLLFRWITRYHEIVVGFRRVDHGKCVKCGKTIPSGNTLCDNCFKKDKDISRK